MAEPDYQSWLAHHFDHPDDEPEWYYADGFQFVEISAQTLAAHALRLFEAPALLMSRYTDTQIAAGLKYLIDSGCGGDIRLISHSDVPHADRLEFAARIDRIYSQIFAARCTSDLGHLSETWAPLNMLCYMWWDIITLDRIGDPRLDAEFDAALFEAMGRTLAIPHAACQEGALHGLGHWGARSLPRTEAMIDSYLGENRAVRPELIAYAKAARCGCVL